LPEPKVAASSARVHGQDVTPVPAPAPSFKFGGLDPGSFGIPTGVAVDGNGNIYVADPIENRIQKFDAQGNFVLQFQLPITCSPATGARLAIDQSSFVYIIGGDAIRGCGGAAVYKFTDTGTLINSWRVTPSFYSFAPAAVAVDNHGFVYTALGNTEPGIYKWTTDGVFVKAFTLGIPNAKDWFTDITTDGTYLYTKRAFVPGAPDQHTFAKFDLDGNLISEWGDPSQFNDGAGIALDASGNIYMVGNNNILKFSKDGQLLGQFGSRGQGSGQFFDPVQLTFDSQGRLYVEDALNSRVQIFDANGTFIRSFGRSTLYIPGSACITGQQIGDYVDGQGNIYVVDEDPLRGGWRVSKFDATGQLLMRNDWADSGFAPGLTGTNANSIVVDKNGNIYLSYWQVTGNGVDRSGIVKLTPSGDFIAANGLATNCYD
jgi:sugar lactone lactonase YvrE